MDTFIHLFRSKTCPQNATELIAQKDRPIISLHVSCFSDATCIGFSLPHSFADVLGMGVIMRAWCSILAGRSSEVPPLFEGDALADFGAPFPSKKAEQKKLYESVQGTYRLWSFWDKVKYYTWLTTSEFILHPSEEVRLLFFPNSLVDKLRKETMLKGEKEKGSAWVSENDIVTALLVKVCSIFGTFVNASSC